MSKNFTEITDAQQLVNAVRTQKRGFIPPKQKMMDSIENDTKYLMALQSFIKEAQAEIPKLLEKNKKIEAFRLQVELLEAIGKFQSNEGIVQDKINHYDNVFLVMYEKELSESRLKFDAVYDLSKDIIKKAEFKNAEAQKILGHIEKEVKMFEDSEIRDKEEYKNYVYKILKRLNNKHEEEQSK